MLYDKTSLYVNDTVRETVTIQNNQTTSQNMALQPMEQAHAAAQTLMVAAR